MKKVLIVDDELLVRMGFRSIIDWESIGFTVIGDAADGCEALEKIRLLHPDLVFTDLRMEHGDGFELMRACAREYPEIRFIVLSSYNDFENVRQAMRCGALDYVFKLDVTPDQLRKILSEIQWPKTEKENNTRSRHRAVCASIIRRAISGETAPEESRAQFEQIYPQIHWDEPFRLITVSIDDYELKKKKKYKDVSLNRIVEIENVLLEVVGEKVVVCPFREDRTLMIWQGNRDEELQQLQMAYVRGEAYVVRYLNESITAVMSNLQENMNFLTHAYAQNEETLMYRYQLERGRIYGYHTVKEEEVKNSPVNMDELERALSMRNAEKVMLICNTSFSQMMRRRGYPLEKLRVCLLDMLFAIKRIYPGVNDWMDADGHKLENLIQHSDRLGVVRDAFLEAVKICAEESPQYRPEIELIVGYVRENLNKEISVSQAAKMTRLSESYFAHVFKREMGMSFVDWVNRERIEQARKLLCQTDRRINEIAAEVGIDNANYFSVLFKKVTGQTPKQVQDAVKKQNRDKQSRI